MTLISTGPHISVSREAEGIRKAALDDDGRHEIARDVLMLEALEDADIAPRLIRAEPDYVIEQDLGVSDWDAEPYRIVSEAALLLYKLRRASVRHGDLSWSNLIRRDGVIRAVDFQESSFFGATLPKDQRRSDAYVLWSSLLHHLPNTERLIGRWLAILGDLGGLTGESKLAGMLINDLGCHEGYMVAMAMAEGVHAIGIDNDRDALARPVWPDLPIRYADLAEDMDGLGGDVGLLLSVWAWVLHFHDRATADAVAAEAVRRHERLYFETQLRGDGPGPDWLENESQVVDYLARFIKPSGSVAIIRTLPVTGRDATRSLIRVRYA